MEKIKPIVFLIHNPDCSSSFVFGDMIKHGLDSVNVTSRVTMSSAAKHIKDSIVVIIKHEPPASIIETLKNNNNKIIIDVVDEFIYPGSTPVDLYDYSKFDGVIVRASKILEVYPFQPHLEVKYIPIHWDVRLQDVKPDIQSNAPIFFGNDTRDMPYLGNLISDGYVDRLPHFEFGSFETMVERARKHAFHYSIRETNSTAYKFKPATKIVTAAAMGIPIITSYDWAVRDLLPSDYPFLEEALSYKELIYRIGSFQSYPKQEALEMLKEVKTKTALVNLIPEYVEFYKRF